MIGDRGHVLGDGLDFFWDEGLTPDSKTPITDYYLNIVVSYDNETAHVRYDVTRKKGLINIKFGPILDYWDDISIYDFARIVAEYDFSHATNKRLKDFNRYKDFMSTYLTKQEKLKLVLGEQ